MALLLKDILKTKMKEQGMATPTLAKKTGISRKTIENWLEGQKPQNIEQVKHVTVKFLSGVTAVLSEAEYLLSGPNQLTRASASNIPLTLAWASTIHKAQGLTLDRAHLDLCGLWEPGHAYVAITRVRAAAGLTLSGWSDSSFQVDQDVLDFHARLEKQK